jgi:hypothetical protein
LAGYGGLLERLRRLEVGHGERWLGIRGVFARYPHIAAAPPQPR